MAAAVVEEAKNSTTKHVNEDMPFAFRWVMAAEASSSSSLTIGEDNKKKNMDGAPAWIIFVSLPAVFVASSALSIWYNKPIWPDDDGFPWFMPVMMLYGVYMAVVHMAMFHLILFVPRAPLATSEALRHVGFEKIGVALFVSSVVVLLFDHYARWMLVIWCCLASVLIAAVLAFWRCVIRIYDEPGSGCWRGLAIGVALSSILAAALIAAFIHLISFEDQTS